MTTDHPPLERLSEFVDGDLAPDIARAVEHHVAGCVTCRAKLVRLRTLIDRAARLPRTIEPPPEAWAGLRDRLSRPARPIAGRAGHWMRWWGLRAAAALLLVAGSSAVTVLVLRSRPAVRVAKAKVPHRRPAALPTVPAPVAVVDRSYEEVVDELTATLQMQRGSLTPTTIATLERALRVIDQAIAEARAALAADPANGALLDVLSANYEQKVDLLRRASELPART